MNKKHIGSTLDSLFEETGELEEVRLLTQKKVIADSLAAAMKAQDVTVSEMSKRMGTSRAAVNRILDPAKPGLTLDSLNRAVTALHLELDIRVTRRREPVAANRPARNKHHKRASR
jgi:antitoxin HicB